MTTTPQSRAPTSSSPTPATTSSGRACGARSFCIPVRHVRQLLLARHLVPQRLRHGVDALGPREREGRAPHLHVYYRALNPGWKDDVPYNVAVVELDEGPFMFSNVVALENEALEVGMRLEAVFNECGPASRCPQFSPAAS